MKKKILKWFWPIMPGYPDEGRRIVQGPHFRALLAIAAKERGKFRRVFNAGSGEGGYSPLLADLPVSQTIVESDLGFRNTLPARIDSRQAFFGASLDSIPLASNSVDLVLCTEVLEHIQQDEAALDDVARILAPGGWFLISVPTPPAPPDANHVREGYRREQLQDMLAARGFHVVETRFCMYFFFRFLLGNWFRLPWCPRIVVRTFAVLDRLFPIGPPMDLVMLAQMKKVKPASACNGAVLAAKRPDEVQLGL